MIYSLRIKRSAAKTLARIAKPDRERLIYAIDRLRNESSAGAALKGEFSGLRRLRVASYRVVYEARNEELVILVIRIGHRKDVYR